MKAINKLGVTFTLIFCMVVSLFSGSAVSDAAKSKIALNKTKIELTVKKSAKVSIKKSYQKKLKKKITWKSSNKKVATVTKTGKVIGRKAGKATITVKGTLKNGKKVSATCKVRVKTKKTAGQPKSTSTPGSLSVLKRQPIQATIKSFAVNRKSGIDELIKQNQIITSYNQLKMFCSMMWAVGDYGKEYTKLAALLEAYDEEYFTDRVLCLGDIEVKWGYNLSLHGVERDEMSDHTKRLNVNIGKEWGKGNQKYAFDQKCYHVVVVEMNVESASGCDKMLCTLRDSASREPSDLVYIEPAVTDCRALEGTMRSVELNTNCSVALRQKIYQNPVVSTYPQMQRFIAELKQIAVKNSDVKKFIEVLQSYPEKYFQKKALCLGVVSETCGYDLNLNHIERDEWNDETSRLRVTLDRVWNVPPGMAVPAVMIDRLLVIETNIDDVAGCLELTSVVLR